MGRTELVGTELCQAASCRSAGEGRGRAGNGSFVCTVCQDCLATDLLNLPALYSDCSGGTAREAVRVIRKVPQKRSTTDCMTPAAAEIRSAIRTVLASWAGLVAEERRLEPPARDIAALARFLCKHVAWLTRHPAAGDLVDEIRELTRAARNIAYPDTIRRVYIGCCPAGDCDGDLVALIRSRSDRRPSEIVCTISHDHSWPITKWTKLARQVREVKGESVGAWKRDGRSDS
jgi:hypothetical protein